MAIPALACLNHKASMRAVRQQYSQDGGMRHYGLDYEAAEMVVQPVQAVQHHTRDTRVLRIRGGCAGDAKRLYTANLSTTFRGSPTQADSNSCSAATTRHVGDARSQSRCSCGPDRAPPYDRSPCEPSLPFSLCVQLKGPQQSDIFAPHVPRTASRHSMSSLAPYS